MEMQTVRCNGPAEWMPDEVFLSLWKDYQLKRSPELWEKLTRENLPLVSYVIRSHPVPGIKAMDIRDVEAYGVLGLMEALTHFDPERYASFVPYAIQRIRGEIFDGILRFLGQQRRYVQKRYRMLQCKAQAEQELMQNPSEREITKRLGMDEKTYAEMLRQTALISPMSLDSEELAESVLKDDTDVETLVFRRDERRLLEEALSVLDPKEEKVVRMYYFEGLSFRKIGERIGCSGSWVSRLHQAAMKHLKELKIKPENGN